MNPELQELARTFRASEGRADIRRQLERVLAPLLVYDARTGSDLARTLRAYVEGGGNLTATADRLFLHRNSVAYRLQRIEELAGIDPRDRATRQLLLVAFALTDASVLQPQPSEGTDEDQRSQ